MAKVSSAKKSSPKKKSKPSSTGKKSPAKKSATDLIEQACEAALQKLKALNADEPLQADLAWCLGSYKHDNNPSGLYIMAERAVGVFKILKKEKPKAIPATLVSSLEKALLKH